MALRVLGADEVAELKKERARKAFWAFLALRTKASTGTACSTHFLLAQVFIVMPCSN